MSVLWLALVVADLSALAEEPAPVEAVEVAIRVEGEEAAAGDWEAGLFVGKARLGWVERKAGCGAPGPYRGLFVFDGSCRPLPGGRGLRHVLSAEADAKGLRLVLDGREVARLPGPLARFSVGLVARHLPQSPLGPVVLDAFRVRRRGRWSAWTPNPASRGCRSELEKGRWRIACASAFGARVATWGEEACAVRDDGRVVCWRADTAIGVMLEGAVEVGAGAAHLCARTADGRVRCWGRNADGQIGGAEPSYAAPVEIPALAGAEALALGDRHTCALIGGRVACVGRTELGQLGDGSLDGVEALAAGVGSTCAVRGGRVLCFGLGYHPSGEGPRGPAPREVLGVEGATALSVGAEHGCAVRGAGGAVCWGRKITEFHTGALPARRAALTEIPGLRSVTAIAAGRLHTCALLDGGRVACWGYNGQGQLGTGKADSSGTPVVVEGLPEIVAIAAGRDHSCALAKLGSVWCWGGRFPRGEGRISSYGFAPLEIRGL